MTDVTLIWRDAHGDPDHPDAVHAFRASNGLAARFLPPQRKPIDRIASDVGFEPHRRLIGVRVSAIPGSDRSLVDAMRREGWDPESHGWIVNHLT